MGTMSDIFISYAREDHPRVERLAEALEQRGWSVWWDPDIRTGEDFGSTIHAALQAARCVIVVWSQQSISSNWVKDEAQVGRERRVLLPVRIDTVEPPLGFRQLQTVDLTGWSPTSPGSAFEKLVADIATILGEREDCKKEGDGEHTEETRESVALSRRRRLLLAGLTVVATAVVAYALVPRTPEPPTEELSCSDKKRDPVRPGVPPLMEPKSGLDLDCGKVLTEIGAGVDISGRDEGGVIDTVDTYARLAKMADIGATDFGRCVALPESEWKKNVTGLDDLGIRGGVCVRTSEGNLAIVTFDSPFTGPMLDIRYNIQYRR
jgi:TIR domain